MFSLELLRVRLWWCKGLKIKPCLFSIEKNLIQIRFITQQSELLIFYLVLYLCNQVKTKRLDIIEKKRFWGFIIFENYIPWEKTGGTIFISTKRKDSMLGVAGFIVILLPKLVQKAGLPWVYILSLSLQNK